MLMPMTFASASTSGPPELPGLIGASVWMRPVSVVLPIGRLRSRPLMMPEVTDAEKPNGLPSAIAGLADLHAARLPRDLPLEGPWEP